MSAARRGGRARRGECLCGSRTDRAGSSAPSRYRRRRRCRERRPWFGGRASSDLWEQAVWNEVATCIAALRCFHTHTDTKCLRLGSASIPTSIKRGKGKEGPAAMAPPRLGKRQHQPAPKEGRGPRSAEQSALALCTPNSGGLPLNLPPTRSTYSLGVCTIQCRRHSMPHNAALPTISVRNMPDGRCPRVAARLAPRHNYRQRPPRLVIIQFISTGTLLCGSPSRTPLRRGFIEMSARILSLPETSGRDRPQICTCMTTARPHLRTRPHMKSRCNTYLGPYSTGVRDRTRACARALNGDSERPNVTVGALTGVEESAGLATRTNEHSGVGLR